MTTTPPLAAEQPEQPADEIERLRYIIGALVEWRDRENYPPWRLRGLPKGDDRRTQDEEIDKASAETEEVWQAARAAIAKATGDEG